MTEQKISHKRHYPPPVQIRQITIGFESTGLLGLTSAQRMKAVMQLSQILIQAAGVAAKESNDEP